MRECGGCTLCCKILGVNEIGKSRNVWCKHVSSDHKGCTIHELKLVRAASAPSYPSACKSFRCLWLESPAQLPDWLRPDRVKAFFTGAEGDGGIVVHLDPGYPFAHEQQPLKGVIDFFYQKKVKLLLMLRERVWMMYQGRWYECETTKTSDGKVEATLKGTTVDIGGVDAATPPPRMVIPFSVTSSNNPII